jgi:hypothetical protein
MAPTNQDVFEVPLEFHTSGPYAVPAKPCVLHRTDGVFYLVWTQTRAYR